MERVRPAGQVARLGDPTLSDGDTYWPAVLTWLDTISERQAVRERPCALEQRRRGFPLPIDAIAPPE